MPYPYEDDEPSICRMCGKDIPETMLIRICSECIRSDQQDTIKIPGVRYGRNHS
jgi:NMD protein affecting ribosome stability and mRNA decay